MNQFEIELKIIAENIAKLYECTEYKIMKDGRDLKYKITEEQVNFELIKDVIELLEKYKKEYTKEELTNLVNTVKKEIAKK